LASLLIIGGTGFFGKSILDSYRRKLLRPWKIDNVIIMSRNPYTLSNQHPELITDGVEYFKGDISNIDYLPSADYVIHAASSSNASRYLSHNLEEKDNIVSGTLNYCRLAEEFHKKSKIVFCSSGAVYGYQPDSLMFLKEDSEFGDVSKLDIVKKSYAYAKRDAEFAIKKLGQSGLDVVVARCFAFIGKYLPKDQHFAIGNFIADGILGRDINVKADRKVYRSYMYADDLIKWLMTLAENAKSNCPIYNVGSNQEIEIRELAKIMSKICNVGVRSIEPNKNSIVDRYIPSIEKAISELGISLQYGLEESIRLSINQ
jgi:nucleoside-diphosphate-sugar epimerase